MVESQVYDVAVIGGGFAGLTVANRVASRGLKPLVLEAGSADKYECNSRVCTGALHVAFRHPEDPPEELLDTIVGTSGGTARSDLARSLTAHAAAVIAWMREEGCDFVQHPRRSYGLPMMAPAREMRPGLDWEHSGPNRFLCSLADKLVARGGELRRSSRVTRILLGSTGVTGVEVRTAGAREEITARAVVIADGGFQADTDLLGRHICGQPDKLYQRNMRTGRGDGIRMAMEVGAATIGLDKFYGHVLSRAAFEKDNLWPYPQLDVICAKGIVVTPDGRRFCDEGLGGIHLANEIAALPDPLAATAIFDARVWDDARETDIVPPNPSLVENGGTLLKAQSLHELADVAGLDGTGLAMTVSAFNEHVHRGDCGQLSPSRRTSTYEAISVEEPPFYAAPLCAGITVTSGGVCADGCGRVLDGDACPIPGLFAAGSTVGGLEGGPETGYVGGLIKAFGIGFIAGEALVAELAT